MTPAGTDSPWYTNNSGRHVHPPRELRPALRGLFDLHGNLLEWTHDWYGEYATGDVNGSSWAQQGVKPLRSAAAAWTASRRIAGRQSAIALPDIQPDHPRLPAGPESVWSLSGGGKAEVSGAVGTTVAPYRSHGWVTFFCRRS